MTSPGPDKPRQPGGTVEISDHAIVAVVHDAVLSCYGIVDMAPRSIRSAIGKRFGLGTTQRGIGITQDEGRLTIDLSVVVEYGTPIFTVATNVMQTVKFRVEELLGMEVDRVNIHVDGLHVSDEAGRAS
ncbi:MAG TPA: Asp23/Gls24 family envelope stress response protein [Thermomicrobiales bacterium]|nr:Asp23/Gls24 family envelope stress response protein [Thermomicrobiales bacterium]